MVKRWGKKNLPTDPFGDDKSAAGGDGADEGNFQGSLERIGSGKFTFKITEHEQAQQGYNGRYFQAADAVFDKEIRT
ncbi:MAG: hypothetical protein JWQ78_670 [Sediminibacterium sp.]|nr:hypothetical protein [Sediminibacterium sp.]